MSKEKTIEEKEYIDFPLFIGSRSRLNFPMSKFVTGTSVYLFVEPQEYQEYSEKYHDLTIIPLLASGQGFTYLLQSMLNYAKQNGISRWMFCDDDVLGWKTRDRKKLPLGEIYRAVNYKMNEGDYAQGMVSFVGHNWYEKKDFKEDIGAWCMIVNDTQKIIENVKMNPELKIYTDWFISASLIRSNLKTYCDYRYYFEHKMKSQKGGAEEIYKKQEVLDQAKDILIKEFGADCIREVEAHNQKEIRFIWKNLKKRQGTLF